VTAPGSPLEALRRAGQQAGLPDFDLFCYAGLLPEILPQMRFAAEQDAVRWNAAGQLMFDVNPDERWQIQAYTYRLATTYPDRRLVVVAWPVEATP